MLTKELSIVKFDGSKIWPDWISQGEKHYLDYERQLVAIYRQGIGRRREDLRQEAEVVFKEEPNCPPKRIRSFIKLLEDAADWHERPVEDCVTLRRRLFTAAASCHPLVSEKEELLDHLEAETKPEIASELNLDLQDAEARLFDDVMENQRLRAFEAYHEEKSLLSAYNVGQTQAMLYRGLKLEVWLGSDYHHVVRHANLCRLMYTVERAKDGRLLFTFDGPASQSRQTRRYGVPMAKFLPALLNCRDWKLKAHVQYMKNRVHTFEISPSFKLKSSQKPPEEFDSDLEARFAKAWEKTPRKGLTLVRDVEPIIINQVAIIPDFLFRRESRQDVYLEIAGFWTQHYLKAKCRKLGLISDLPLILAIPESTSFQPLASIHTVRYKGTLKVGAVLSALEHIP